MEKLKINRGSLEVDLRKSYLNHLLVFIVSIGASISKMFIDNNMGHIFYAGICIILSCIITYILVSYQLEKDLKDLK